MAPVKTAIFVRFRARPKDRTVAERNGEVHAESWGEWFTFGGLSVCLNLRRGDDQRLAAALVSFF
jgi:hypothetical protein